MTDLKNASHLTQCMFDNLKDAFSGYRLAGDADHIVRIMTLSTAIVSHQLALTQIMDINYLRLDDQLSVFGIFCSQFILDFPDRARWEPGSLVQVGEDNYLAHDFILDGESYRFYDEVPNEVYNYYGFDMDSYINLWYEKRK